MKIKEDMFVIEHIYWERIFLHIEMKTTYKSDEIALSFIREDGKKVRFDLVDFLCSENKVAFSVNIASVADRSFLDNGRWRLAVETEEGSHICTITEQAAYGLEPLTRIFKYAENQMAYNVSFGVDSDDEKMLKLYFDSYFMIENRAWRKRRYVKEVRRSKDKLKRGVMSICVFLIKIYYGLLYNIIPKNGKRIMIMSETKDILWGNLKYIDDGIKARKLDEEYKITYSYRSAVGKHQSISDILSWVKVVTKIAAQDVIFVDDYAPVFGFFELGKKTKLIQVWHAGEGFKSVGYSRFGKEGSPFPQKSCHKQYTHVITGSEHLVKVFQEVFAIEKEAFYPVGMPRLDNFLDEVYIDGFKEEFYLKYPYLKEKRIILFAPTYRGSEQKEAYYDYDKIDLKQVYEYCKKTNSVFLIKMHPFVKELIEIADEYGDAIYEFSKYPNINDLYYITDLLITDYSSNYFEYALLKKPVVFYTYDRQIYELTRGVHRSIEESAPGKVCDTFSQLMDCLINEEYEIEKLIAFVEDNFGEYKGNATDRIINEILLKEA